MRQMLQKFFNVMILFILVIGNFSNFVFADETTDVNEDDSEHYKISGYNRENIITDPEGNKVPGYAYCITYKENTPGNSSLFTRCLLSELDEIVGENEFLELTPTVKERIIKVLMSKRELENFVNNLPEPIEAREWMIENEKTTLTEEQLSEEWLSYNKRNTVIQHVLWIVFHDDSVWEEYVTDNGENSNKESFYRFSERRYYGDYKPDAPIRDPYSLWNVLYAPIIDYIDNQLPDYYSQGYDAWVYLPTINSTQAMLGDPFKKEYGKIEIQKSDDVSNVGMTEVSFGIFSDENCENLVSEVLTGANGKAKSDLLELGTYYIKELNVPEFYKENTRVERVDLSNNREIVSFPITNMPMGTIVISKKNSINSELVPNATFGVYSDSNCTDLIEEVTTDENGMATTSGIEAGTYYIKELEAPLYYKLNPEVKSIEITIAGESAEVEIEDIPQGYIKIIKKDSETEKLLPNTTFGIYSDEECLDLVSEITTNSEGTAKSELLDAGTYFIKELQVPEYYKINQNIKMVTISEAGQTVEAEITNDPQGYIEITKKDAITKKALEGAKFGIYEDSDCEDLIFSETTDENGRILTPLVEAGTYYIKELEAPENYKLSSDVKSVTVKNAGVTVNEEFTNIPLGNINVTKKDFVTDETLVGAEFGIYTDSNCKNLIEEVKIESDGIAKLENLEIGTYYVKETKAPINYKLNSVVKEVKIEKAGDTAKTEIKDIPQGYLSITKKDSKTGRVLAGCSFGVYTDKQCKNLVAELTTDNLGKAKTSLLDAGTYYVKEIKAINKYILNEEIYTVDIKEAGATVNIDVLNDPEEVVKKEPQVKTEIKQTKVKTESKESPKTVVEPTTVSIKTGDNVFIYLFGLISAIVIIFIIKKK